MMHGGLRFVCRTTAACMDSSTLPWVWQLCIAILAAANLIVGWACTVLGAARLLHWAKDSARLALLQPHSFLPGFCAVPCRAGRLCVSCRRPMRLGGGLGGDSRLPKEPRKKILADAAARGVAAPPGADDRPPRYGTKGREAHPPAYRCCWCLKLVCRFRRVMRVSS
jgi:hypothetical protein